MSEQAHMKEDETVETTTLDNGLRIVSHYMPHLETTSLGVWINSGTRAESTEEHGLAHLLEHMAFKGTEKRSAQQIVEDIEAAGGELNAATSFETTCYYARVLKNDMPLAIDILSDILQHPIFDEVEFKKEKDVIFQEIAASFDNPEDVAFDLLQELAYKDQALGRPILGTPESVSHLTTEQLHQYRNRCYTADNMIIASAGGTQHDHLVSMVKNEFHKLQPCPQQPIVPAKYCGGRMTSGTQFEQSHIIIAFKGFAYADNDYYAGQVFNVLFGGGMSSRLFQQVREKRGLCYSIYSFCWGLSDTGIFGVHAATGPELVAELTNVVVEELRDIAAHGPATKEVERSKAQIKAGLLMSLESSITRAEQLARQLFVFGRPLTNDELLEHVEKVDAKHIQTLVDKMISDSAPLCCGVGPMDQLQTYEWFLQKFSK